MNTAANEATSVSTSHLELAPNSHATLWFWALVLLHNQAKIWPLQHDMERPSLAWTFVPRDTCWARTFLNWLKFLSVVRERPYKTMTSENPLGSMRIARTQSQNHLDSMWPIMIKYTCNDGRKAPADEEETLADRSFCCGVFD